MVIDREYLKHCVGQYHMFLCCWLVLFITVYAALCSMGGYMGIWAVVKNEILKSKLYIFMFFITYTGVLFLQVFVPFVSGHYIDVLAGKHSGIMLFVSGIAVLNLFSLILEYCMAFIMTKLNNTFLYRICNAMFQTIFRAPLKYFRSQDAVYLTDQVTGDSATIAEFILNDLPDLIYNFILVITSAAIIFTTDVSLGVLIILTVPIYFFTYKLLQKRMYQNEENYKTAGNDYTSKGVEQIRCTKFVKENSLYNEMEERLKVSFDNMLKCATGQVKTQYLFTNLNRLIMIFCYIFVIWAGGRKVIEGSMSIGFFTIINSYLNMVVSSAEDIVNFSSGIQEVRVSVDRMNRILEQTGKENKGNTYERIDRIELRNFGFSYDGKNLFSGINFLMEKNHIYGIKGGNGTGKSSLLDAITGFYPECCQGDILYNNKSVYQFDMELMLKNEIAFLEQNSEKLNISARDYIQFGTGNCDAMKTGKLIAAFFDGDRNNPVERDEENINLCSGGEIEKLSLIRVLQKDSSLLILDEPDTGLDDITIRKLLKILECIKENRIIIVVTHDERVLDICDSIFELEIQDFV